jgi:hypothetical protein
MGRKISKKLREHLSTLEREKDTVYFLDFTPLSGIPYQHSTLLDDIWCVNLFGNPEGKPEIIDAAIKTFEKKHNVKAWAEVAISYKLNSFYFP